MATKIEIEIDEYDLKKIVLEYIQKKLNSDVKETDIMIETKSKQNYRAEWENGAGFRARVSKHIT